MVAAGFSEWIKVGLSWSDIRTSEGLRRVAAGLTEAEAEGAGLHVDFSPMTGDSAERSSLRWVAAIGNVVLNSVGESPLRVSFPESDPGRLLIYRSGLVYGLARRLRTGRDGELTGFEKGAAVTDWLRLWSEPWRPGGLGMDGRLLDDEPRPIDTEHAVRNAGTLAKRSNAKNAICVIVDPHRREKSTIRQSASMGLARGWIGAVLPGSRDVDVLKRRRLWKDVVTQRILTEALDNITDHAFVRPNEAHPLPERDAASYVTLARTDGGGEKSAPRLQLVIADNGYGVPATLRAKLGMGSIHERALATEATGLQLAAHAFRQRAKTATDPGLLWARTGFVTALDEAAVLDDEAELTMLTSDDATGTLVVVRIDRNDEVHQEEFSDVPYRGTTILATLPMPHRLASGSDVVATPSRSGLVGTTSH